MTSAKYEHASECGSDIGLPCSCAAGAVERLERTVTVLEEVLKGVAQCDRCESCRENAKAALELLEIDREHPPRSP